MATLIRYRARPSELVCGVKYLVEIAQPTLGLTFISYACDIEPPDGFHDMWVIHFENDVTLRLHGTETVTIVEGL